MLFAAIIFGSVLKFSLDTYCEWKIDTVFCLKSRIIETMYEVANQVVSPSCNEVLYRLTGAHLQYIS